MTVKASISNTEIVRPDNTTEYAAGDAWLDETSDPTTPSIDISQYNADTIEITQAKVVFDGDSPPAFLLYLYEDSPTIPTGDNAEFLPTYADQKELIARFANTDATKNYTVNSVTVYEFDYDVVSRMAKLASGDTSLYPVLVVNETHTPGSEDKVYIEVGARLS